MNCGSWYSYKTYSCGAANIPSSRLGTSSASELFGPFFPSAVFPGPEAAFVEATFEPGFIDFWWWDVYAGLLCLVLVGGGFLFIWLPFCVVTLEGLAEWFVFKCFECGWADCVWEPWGNCWLAKLCWDCPGGYEPLMLALEWAGLDLIIPGTERTDDSTDKSTIYTMHSTQRWFSILHLSKTWTNKYSTINHIKYYS